MIRVFPGRRIRNIRESKKVTMKALADHLGIHPAFWEKVERGQVDPPIELIHKAAIFFGVDVVMFLGENLINADSFDWSNVPKETMIEILDCIDFFESKHKRRLQ